MSLSQTGERGFRLVFSVYMLYGGLYENSETTIGRQAPHLPAGTT